MIIDDVATLPASLALCEAIHQPQKPIMRSGSFFNASLDTLLNKHSICVSLLLAWMAVEQTLDFPVI